MRAAAPSRPRVTPQGGDLRDLDPSAGHLDLGTCVNRYGPPPEVAEALAALDLRQLRAHPYEAEDRFRSSYARALGVDREQLVAGRGISEFIRVLARLLREEGIAVIAPDYTDTVGSIAVHLGPPPDGTDSAERRLARVEAGLATYPYVMLSNPNNPTGVYVESELLVAACRAHPRSTLIVDEAFIDFIDPRARRSMVHAELENLVVLRSPNKLFGIAGTRTGVMFTANAPLRERVRRLTLNWPLSFLDATVACAALDAQEWADVTRSRLLATAARMEDLLKRRYPSSITGVPVHYRFIPSEDPEALYGHFLAHGVVVRTFSGEERGRVPGIRVTAPTEIEFDGIDAAFE